DDFSPAWSAADWLLSWGLFAGVLGMVAWTRRFGKTVERRNRRWALSGSVLAVALLLTSGMLVASPWKNAFNAKYAATLLREHGKPGDPQYGFAVYEGNLILAQIALDTGDVARAKQFLLEAGTSTGFPRIARNGPDTNVARALLQMGDRNT